MTEKDQRFITNLVFAILREKVLGDTPAQLKFIDKVNEQFKAYAEHQLGIKTEDREGSWVEIVGIENLKEYSEEYDPSDDPANHYGEDPLEVAKEAFQIFYTYAPDRLS